ncbi:hypothetical protein CH063_11126 [Colletotrichum higginsianum]|uniref:FAD binding domain-containing protein n=2 Tax=Colletotrichum higginsianum TaxID=80884 RepID=H1VK49_COLHI|nr:FAD binding domain-containing protein [Colletotrichum higginsianum IMI 349063]OBR04200.1 FAD binding domain-containing protein [Colletotrichum higginsianum IMI 349063]TIC90316.1 hypothetical protein CH35J_012175 [Colletotrichum higginsianum]CCF40602.1 hypothetical protein CH063_11126 [Colletotrichum higginsianum]
MSKPTVLVVHGAWHTPAHYQPFVDVLEDKGYPCVVPKLPSGDTLTPASAPEDDIRLVRKIASDLTEQGKEIIVLAHSYGGTVSTEALSGLGIKDRAVAGKSGGVRLLVYLAAFIAAGEESLEDFAPPGMFPWLRLNEDETVATLAPQASDLFYSDVPKAEHEKWAGLWTATPAACSQYRTKSLAYKDIDTAYIHTEQDAVISAEAQRVLVGRVKDLGVEIREESLPSGHFPSLSMPKEFADLFVQLIGDY